MWKNNAEKRDANAIYTFVKLFLQLNPLCNLHKKMQTFLQNRNKFGSFCPKRFFWHFSGFDAQKAKEEQRLTANRVGQ